MLLLICCQNITGKYHNQFIFLSSQYKYPWVLWNFIYLLKLMWLWQKQEVNIYLNTTIPSLFSAWCIWINWQIKLLNQKCRGYSQKYLIYAHVSNPRQYTANGWQDAVSLLHMIRAQARIQTHTHTHMTLVEG